MKFITILLCFLLFDYYKEDQINNPFLSLEFDKVILYDYEPAGEDPSLINKESQLIGTINIKKQVILDNKTIQTLSKKMGEKSSYGQVTEMCFKPHLGIVYYRKGKAVRHAMICLECNILRADIDIPAQHQNKQVKGNTIYYLEEGMSKSFRQYINGLLIKYEFSNKIQSGSHFDK